MGSRAGRLDGGIGDGSCGEWPPLGEGGPVKLRRRGVAWKGACTGDGDRKVEPDGLGGGLEDGLDTIGWAGPVWAPLDDEASGFEVAGRREVRVVAMIR